jgi:hypothetical protein
MEARHIQALEQDYCRVTDHVFETFDKTKREAKYRVETGSNDIDLYDISPIASDIPKYQLILRR